MPALQRFEDIQAWQEARELSRWVYELTSESLAQDPGLRDLLRRAASSSMTQIVWRLRLSHRLTLG